MLAWYFDVFFETRKDDIALIRFITWGIYPLRGFEVLAFVILSCLTVVGWIVGVISALAGKYTKLPFAGDYAERNLPPNPQTMVK